ncbi:CpaF family protein [Nocardioides currus]|uniref:Pilus assembly protein CpaF n=1 Tax=Nocardioides currus TaxID=2133958 RepID=A0A2R7YXJ9_9ACTN|nr:CpaF family protein [Nocardioides currus]PUA80609.1 pilus assembly protein CpaF [Nocardioides currus]
MSLSDRIAAAQRSAREPAAAPAPQAHVPSHAAPPAAPVAPAGEPVGPSAAAHAATRPAAPTSTPGTQSTALASLATPKKSGRDPFATVKKIVHARLVEALGPKLYDAHMTQTELEQQVHVALQTALAEADQPMSSVDRARVSQEIADDILGYGPLEPLLRDSDLSEVMVNAFDSIYIERSGKLVKTDSAFADEAHLRRTIDKIVSKIGRRVDETSPMVDARLPDGSRVNAIIPPLALDGSKLTIRKFSEDPYTVEDLIGFNTLSRQAADLLEGCVRGRLNILVSGGTGAGKTTTLNVLSSFIPHDERIVTIEDAAELRLHQDHVLRLESRPANIEGKGAVTIRDLVKNSLRMRPDRIVVGEIRDAAALDMLQAMNTGHDGSISTLHANTPRDGLSRLETMVLMAGMDLPVRAIREQVASAVDLIIQQTRLKDGTRRITAITEIVGMEGDIITTQDVFLFDYSAGTDEHGKFKGNLKSTGLRPRFLEHLADHGVKIDPAVFATGAGR